MAVKHGTQEVAAALRVGIGSLVRRLRQVHPDGGLSMSETSALARLDREGPTTSGALAKLEQITPQSMGVTLSALELRGLIQRRPDPDDGRRAVMSLTRVGRDVVLRRRDASTEVIARSLAANFTTGEIEQLRVAAVLIERLAHTL
jgi:DNA-binding MarR family transcriptional regulator